MNFLYDAFISFAWRDLRRARRLQELLHAAGYVTWYAEQNLRGGEDIPKELWAGLERSRFVFVIHSKHYAGAAWAERELSVATTDEINCKVTKVVFLLFDDVPVPYGMRHKLYIDFRDPKKKPLDQVSRVLDQASDGVIRGVTAAMVRETNLTAIRAASSRLSEIAKRRGEELVVRELRALLLDPATPRQPSDSAAWALGDIGMADIPSSLAEAVRATMNDCVASSDARLIAHMAWIAGEMVMAARRPDMVEWADHMIKMGLSSTNPETRRDFEYTRERTLGRFRGV